MYYTSQQKKQLPIELTAVDLTIDDGNYLQIREYFEPAASRKIARTGLETALLNANALIQKKTGITLLPQTYNANYSASCLLYHYLTLPFHPLRQVISFVLVSQQEEEQVRSAIPLHIFSRGRGIISLSGSVQLQASAATDAYLETVFSVGYLNFELTPPDLRRIFIALARFFFLRQGEAGLAGASSAVPQDLVNELAAYRSIKI